MNRKQHTTSKGKAGDTMQAQAATATPGGANLLTLGELATRLRMHKDTVRRLKREGTIPALVIGHRTLRFSWPDVLDKLRQAQATK